MDLLPFQIQNLNSKLQEIEQEINQVVQNAQTNIQMQKQETYLNKFQIQQMQPHQVLQQMQKTSVFVIDQLIQRSQEIQRQLIKVDEKINEAIQIRQMIQQKQSKLGSQTVEQVQTATQNIQKLDELAQKAIQKLDNLVIQEQKYMWNLKQSATNLMIFQNSNPQISTNQFEKNPVELQSQSKSQIQQRQIQSVSKNQDKYPTKLNSILSRIYKN